MGRNHGLLVNLIVGIIGAFVGGFLFSSLLGFRYAEGFNLPSIVVATVEPWFCSPSSAASRTGEASVRPFLLLTAGITILSIRDRGLVHGTRLSRCTAATRNRSRAWKRWPN